MDNAREKMPPASAKRKRIWNHQIKQPAQRLHQKYIVEMLLRQKPLPPSKNGRRIPLRAAHAHELIDERRGLATRGHYTSNSIRSSRYTVWDFLPKQIFFQATRLANFYFICIGIPQTIPGFSTTGNFTTILPLLFFLILTIAKEGYDDFRRHRMDKVENNYYATAIRPVHVNEGLQTAWRETIQQWFRNLFEAFPEVVAKRLRSPPPPVDDAEGDYDEVYKWKKVKWHNIKVGDVLRLKRDEPAPADIALLHASGENGMAYVDTMALDGETNLKSRQAPATLRDLRSIASIKQSNASLTVEDPNRNLYDFNGSVTVDGQTLPLTMNEIVLRGCTIRNTATVIGVVVNTGEECKIRMNANHHPKAKIPRLERYTNQVVLVLIAYVVIVSFGCFGGYIMWRGDVEQESWYIRDASVPLQQVIVGYLIMFNNVIPLALYITLEIVKVIQMLMISSDMQMYDEETNTPMVCNTNTIMENLGQISYVLTDKTGTLTENIMKFRGLSVGGTAWTHQDDTEKVYEDNAPPRMSTTVLRNSKDMSTRAKGAGEGPSIVVQEAELPTAGSSKTETADRHARPSFHRHSTDRNRQEEPRQSTTEMLEHVRLHPNAAFSCAVREFLLGMALCHTALPETKADGSVDFQASSPDELALVRAAKELGICVVHRTTQMITVSQIGADGLENRSTYDILDVIEFTSKRKRMSIILRCPDGTIWLLCKGADSAILPRLAQASLATNKSMEVRRSMQVERDMARKSEQLEPRASLGARPSLVVRGRSSQDIRMSLEIRNASKSPFGRMADARNLRSPPPGRARLLLDSSVNDEAGVFSRCFKHLDKFATEGLRTLVYAHKVVLPSEYSQWKKTYQEATTSLADRQELVEAAGDTLEQGFRMLGASAIEDKLQKDVPETIDKLRRANMKIWVLTGDKRETAINIAHSAQICLPTSEIYTIDAAKGDLEGQLKHVLEEVQATTFHSVVVIDGNTLAILEADDIMTSLFYSLIPLVSSVICCRASPAQKADIVLAIKKRHKGLTMAIGDGGNDIAMISAAHVGIGISGREGLQAARVADFSIAQFRFLQRLLFVHGRWTYDRTAKFILWTYWREMFFYMVQALYQGYVGYSGSSLYEMWSLTALNTLFTSLSCLLPGVFEQDLRAETLLAIPELYIFGQRNRGLHLSKFLMWMAYAVGEGFAIWFIPYTLYGVHNELGDNNTFALGHLCFSISIMWTNAKLLLLHTSHKTWVVLFGFFITTSGWWAWSAFLDGVYGFNISPFDVRNSFTTRFGTEFTWWAVLFITLMVLTVAELCLLVLGRWLRTCGYGWLWKGKGALQEWDVPLWQEAERDPVVWRRLQALARGEEVLEETVSADVETEMVVLGGDGKTA